MVRLVSRIEGSKIIYTLEDISSIDKPVILTPFSLMKKKDPLEHSWQVTSDSIAAYVAHQVGASLLVLLKDEDGIFDTNGNVYKEIGSKELSDLRESCVDKMLPILIKKYQVKCWIVNERYPNRLEKLVFKGKTFGTKIVP